MDNKAIILLIACWSFLLPSCKTNKWYDWKELNEAMLVANRANNPDIEVTSSGLQYRILADPNKTEQCPHSGCIIQCDYETRLLNGTLIDKREGSTLAVYNLIPGVQEGLRHIHVHGDIELWIPYKLAYGETGSGTEGYKSFVPPYSALYFKVHVHASTAD